MQLNQWRPFSNPNKKKVKNQWGFSHLISTETPLKNMNLSRNGNKRSSIEIKNKGIGQFAVNV
jgi:hypothetical protein